MSRATGLQTQGIVSFLGLPMNAQLNITSQTNTTTNSSSLKMSVGMQALNANLTNVVQQPRMWPSAPNMVMKKLGSFRFPRLEISSNNGVYRGAAGPIDGVTLVFGVDTNGLRFIKLTMANSCMSLGGLAGDMGIGLAVPDNMFSLCSPSVQYIPSYSGVPAFSEPVLTGGTAAQPSATVSFVLTMAALGLDRVAASITYAMANGLSPAALTIRIPSNFSIMDSWATARGMTISDITAGRLKASLNMSIPDLGLRDAATILRYTNETDTFSFELTGDLTLLNGVISVKSLNLTVGRNASFVQASCSGLLAGSPASVSFNTTLPRGNAAYGVNRTTSLSVTVPDVNVGTLLRAAWPAVAEQLPSIVLDVTFPDLRLLSPDTSTGLYRVRAGPTLDAGITVDVSFDQKGLLMASVQLNQRIGLKDFFSKLGVDLPIDTDDLLTITSPVLHIMTNRTDVNISALGLPLLRSPGWFLSLGLNVPPLSNVPLPCDFVVKDSSGSFNPNITFQINDTISLADGIFSLSNLNLALSRTTGLQAQGTANFLGLPMNAQLNITSQTNMTTNVTSLGMLGALKAVNTGLVETVKNPRMWSSAPNLVVQKLRSITFPALDITSCNGTYRGVAGPVGGVLLSFALDNNGLRNIRLDMAGSCLSLGSLLNDMDLGLSVPDDVLTLCSPFVQYVPAYPGLPGFIQDNGTMLPSAATLGFALTIPALKLQDVAARLDYAMGNGVPVGSLTIKLGGTFSFLDGFATVHQMVLSGLSRAGFQANLTISIPELNMVKADASLSYTAASKVFSIQITGLATVFSGSVVLQTVYLTVNSQNGTLQGSATGMLDQYNSSTSFTYQLADPNTPGSSGAFQEVSVVVPTVNMGRALRTIGPSTTKMLPNILLDRDIPSIKLSSSSGSSDNLYRVIAGPTSDGILADITFDRDGVLLGTVEIRESSFDIGKALNQLAPSINLGSSFDGVVTIYQPFITVVSNRAASVLGSTRGTLMAPGTYVRSDLSVPPLMGGNRFSSTMRILDGDGNFISDFTIGWQGAYSPIRHVTITGASLSVMKGIGLVGTANGIVVGVSVTLEVVVADSVAKDQGASALTFTATFRNMILSDVLATLFPSTPQLILNILSNAKFTELVLSYNGGDIGVSGVPDLSNVAALSSIINFLGFSSNDVRIKPGAGGAVQIAIDQLWDLDLGDPFVGKSRLAFQFQLSQEGANTKIACGADFVAGIRMSFLDPEVVNFNLGATVTYDSTLPPPGISIMLKANVTSRIAVKGFNYIAIEQIGGVVGIQPQPLSITYVMFSARANFVGTSVAAWFMYDQAQSDFAFTFSVINFNPEGLLNAIGVPARLAAFGMKINYAFVSYAKREINFKPPPEVSNKQTIPAGFLMTGNLTMLSFAFQFKTAIDPDGLEFMVEAWDVTSAGILGSAFRAAQEVLDILHIDIQVSDIVSVKHVKFNLVLRKAKIAISFSLKMTLLGININIDDLGLELNDPWGAIVNLLKGKILEPLTAACTKGTYGRGVGLVIDTCPSGYEKQGALCYPLCPTDWEYGSYGRLNICYQNCPPGYRDDFGDVGLTCSRLSCPDGSHLSGLMCYENCRAGYYYWGGVCYEDCTPGQTDIGALCSENFCDPGDDDNGAGMCYPACRWGYSSNGLTMCIQNTCPAGYDNHPLTCYRGFDTYGKGCCCTWFGCCNRGCSPGFSDDGGCMCTKWADIIWKSTYDRGVGYPKFRLRAKKSYIPRQWGAVQSFSKRTQSRGSRVLGCATDKEYDAGLCYPYCSAGYTGVGPLCWQTACPPGLTDCGTYCAPSAAGSCANFVGAMWQNCVDKFGLQTRNTPLVGDALGDYMYDYQGYTGLHCDGVNLDSLECSCYNREAGIIPNRFGGPSSYIVCALNATYVRQCDDDLVFNPVRRACDLPPPPPSPTITKLLPNCTAKSDGYYIVDPHDFGTAYKCVNGTVDLNICGPGLYLNTSSGICEPSKPSAMTPPPRPSTWPAVPPAAGDSRSSPLPPPVLPQQLPEVCRNISCFCRDKPDARYPDVLGMNMHRYIRCKGGVGRTLTCPPLFMFDNRISDCNEAPRNGTQLVPNCQELECFCVGRPDGVYDSPFVPGTGIRCVKQYGYAMQCPDGFRFDSNKTPFCQQRGDWPFKVPPSP
ncbi:hypothetical protein PLESTB_001487800 [Pleodorina starrii]|uniref:Chitin-binding type-2 domain-containing protein n=1 Tax=Pleodorina starrii TaxID=330485 RepID=A0A9W6F7R0_9CHLO|nr:hypothetical protein PLESTB_001487800 [Pleodorina starrii]